MNTTKTPAEIVAALLEHFPANEIFKRPDGYDYIDQEKIMRRLIECTGGVFDIEIVSGPDEFQFFNERKQIMESAWKVNVRLTIPGLGSRSNVGTQMALNEDSPKGAVTDAIKKAASLFGVGLHLYYKAEQPQANNRGGRGKGNYQGSQQSRPAAAPAPRQSTATAQVATDPINESGERCPGCKARPGAIHLRSCTAVHKAA